MAVTDWSKFDLLLPAIDKCMDSIAETLGELDGVCILPTDAKDAEIALWNAFIEEAKASSALVAARNKLESYRIQFAKQRVTQLEAEKAQAANAAVATERVPDAVSKPTEGSGPGVQPDSGQSV